MRILILSPHPDDVELCMGGTIAKLVEQGHKIRVLFFSQCEVPYCEIANSMTELGLKNKSWYVLNYMFRTMANYRDEIRTLLKEEHDKGYDIVYSPHPSDHHQDHSLVAEVATNIFGTGTDLIYYLWHKNMHSLTASVFNELSDEELDKKVKAVMSYRSQVKARPMYYNAETVKSMAVFYGTMVSCHYAEAFQPYRMKHI